MTTKPPDLVAALTASFRHTKELADRAIAQLPDEKLHVPLDPNTNSIDVIMKHIAGNLRSRWTDFLASDGEKPTRDRDGEFTPSRRSRAESLADWESGWRALFDTLGTLAEQDLARTVAIRGEPHSVPLAACRSLAHCGYHAGQIVMIARIVAGERWQTITVPRGGSREHNQKTWGTSQYDKTPLRGENPN